MKTKRVISIILAAFIIISLCVFAVGCQPSEEDIKKKELETAKVDGILAINNIVSYYKNNIEKYYDVLKADEDINALLSAELLNDYIDDQYGNTCLLIKKAETVEQVKNYVSEFRFSMNTDIFSSLNSVNFEAYCFYPINEINFRTEENDSFAIKMEHQPYSGITGIKFVLETSDKTLKCKCIAQSEKIDFKTAIITAENKSPFIYNALLSGYFDFIIYNDNEILGYAIFDFDGCKLIKSVVFKKADRTKINEEMVLDFIEKAKHSIDGEKSKNIVPINQINSYKYDYPMFSVHPVFEFDKVYYEISYNETNDYETYCWSDGERFLYDGEYVKSTDLKKGDTVKWEIGSMLNSYIYISVGITQDDGKRIVTEIFMIKTINITEQDMIPKVVGVGFGGQLYKTTYSDKRTKSFINTIKRLVDEEAISL